MVKLLKVGLFGGTFNPIHVGHLINAQFIREEFNLDFILFIPTKYPVHKELEYDVDAEHRYRMVKLAIEGVEYFKVSRLEIDRNRPSYTIFTIDDILKENPDWQLFFIIGYDAFNEIDTWKDWQRLLLTIDFIIMKRPGDILHKRFHQYMPHIHCANNPVIDVSSSTIRERVKNGKPIKYLLPYNVEEYIDKRGLYQSEG
ncbi:MAG: nicotinate-nucleotide adenylyltransferase [Spirochaetes bacterium]|nr:nicotinate-nucleotide adenylyltransferase [Spirochaetota bacterium]